MAVRGLPETEILSEMLSEIASMVRSQQGRGKVADYIPELGRVDPRRFAMAVVTVDGEEAVTGDADLAFSLQSITKVPALLIALNSGGDGIWELVGKEPSGTPFNFLAQLEAEQGVPRNPFINAGAIATTAYLMRRIADPALMIRAFLRFAAQSDAVEIDDAVAASELASAHKNRAIASLLHMHGTISQDPESVLATYCRQCALAMSLRNLTRAFLPLAAGGYSPIVGETLMTRNAARRICALMMTCGMYDTVGSFAYRVGLPAKSGVGGGIVAIVPGVAAIGVWAPELDRCGNSLLGTLALEQFVRLTGLSILA